MEDRLYPREKYLKKLVKIITGVRGSGKTSLFELLMNELRESSVEEENIISIRLDKRPYKGVKTAGQLIEIIRDKISDTDGIKYVFLDEIGNVTMYESAINVLSENNDISFFISSSSAYITKPMHLNRLSLLHADFEVFTLTFDEYLDMKLFYGCNVSGNSEEEFMKYMLEGGFPYVVRNEIHDSSHKYERELISDIIELDIRKNKRIKDFTMFNAVKSYVINRFTEEISIKSMQESLAEKLNKSVRKETLYNYLEILEDARLVYKCERFDMKSKRIMRGKERYFLADLSFYYAEDMYNTLEVEPSAENVVYIYARSLDFAVASGKNARDNADFIMEDTDMDYIYINVTDYLDKGDILDSGRTKKEEEMFSGLERIKNSYPKFVISLDKIMRKRNGIKQRNIIELTKTGIKI